MRKFAEHGVSFTDCVSIALLKKEGTKDVFGFDRHFEYADFRILAPASRGGTKESGVRRLFSR